MGITELVAQLEALGYKPIVKDNRAVIDYEVPVGCFEGEKIRLGFDVHGDFPINPPTGPHISPRLLPINENASKHPERVHNSNFGEDFDGEWEYWSRPVHYWQNTDRSVKVYLKHINYLFETQ